MLSSRYGSRIVSRRLSLEAKVAIAISRGFLKVRERGRERELVPNWSYFERIGLSLGTALRSSELLFEVNTITIHLYTLLQLLS
jgi:hypothetical protein